MDSRLKYILISMIIFSLSAKFFLIFLNHGLWWDEAVYLNLGRNIQKGFYSLDPEKPLETFRSPVFPLLISPFSESVLLVRILVVMFSIISVIFVYFFSKDLFGKETALWTSLFLSTNHVFIFFTTKALTESVFISFLILSLLFFFRRKNKTSYLFLSGIFSGFAFLTRYLGTILVFSYILYFLYLFLLSKRNMKNLAKQFITMFGGIFLVLSPWFMLSHVYYGNILGSYYTNMIDYSDYGKMFIGYFSNVIRNYFSDVFRAFGLQLFFIILGLYVMLKQGKGNYRILFTIIFFLPVIFFFLDPYRKPRYMLSYLPVYAVFSAFALRCEFKRIGRYLPCLAILVCIFSMFTGFAMAWNDRYAASGLVQAALYVRNVTGDDDYIMTQSYPYIYYLSGRRATVFPRNLENLEGEIKEKNIRYILLYKFEPKNPDYTKDYFDRNSEFKLIRKFTQWGDPEAVKIYELRGFE